MFLSPLRLCLCVVVSLGIVPLAYAHIQSDSLAYELGEVMVSHRAKHHAAGETLPAQTISVEKLRLSPAGSLVEKVAQQPGVQVLSIGSGFAKPVIRGMAFNRVAYVVGGLKQVGQAWGADHGLEADSFDDSPTTVVMGPASIRYGSEAHGGVIVREMAPLAMREGLSGAVALAGHTLYDGGGGSVRLSWRKSTRQLNLRLSSRLFADRRTLADSLVYLSQVLPLKGHRLTNTAGQNHTVSLTGQASHGDWLGRFWLEDFYERSGFFAAAHGVPNPEALLRPKKHYEVQLPYAVSNHFRLATEQIYHFSSAWRYTFSLAYQHNLRRELSLFHTHYADQQPPEKQPDLEMELALGAISLANELRYKQEAWEANLLLNGEISRQRIAGYGFLLPPYRQQVLGLGGMVRYRPHEQHLLEGGIRYDWGHVAAPEVDDPYLANYLTEKGASAAEIAELRMRSKRIDRSMGSLSLALGWDWSINEQQGLKLSLARGFRMPNMHELSAAGVHHGAFRHEQGDASLLPEIAWQLAAAYHWQGNSWRVDITPYAAYMPSYIYLAPSGEWSPLPHAGQLFRYRQHRAFMLGSELQFMLSFGRAWEYHLEAEALYSQNLSLGEPLPFTPPVRVRQKLAWHRKAWRVELAQRIIAPQVRTVPGEETTPGAILHDLALIYNAHPWQIRLAVDNITNQKYFNHLAFYRRLGVPEAGRNLSFTINFQW